jgi:hypothetical protein
MLSLDRGRHELQHTAILADAMKMTTLMAALVSARIFTIRPKKNIWRVKANLVLTRQLLFWSDRQN